jgi:hypothetical protein
MASILKVDTIQTPSGSAPTADGLGIAHEPGSIIQTQTAWTNATQTYNGTSLIDVTGMSVNITPKYATSKIMVLVTICWGASNDTYAKFRVVRNGVALGLGPSGVGSAVPESFSHNNDNAHGTYDMCTNTWQYLDSPTTTSTLTYKLQMRPMITTTSRTWRLNHPENQTDANRTTGSSSITVFEIAQ